MEWPTPNPVPGPTTDRVTAVSPLMREAPSFRRQRLGASFRCLSHVGADGNHARQARANYAAGRGFLCLNGKSAPFTRVCALLSRKAAKPAITTSAIKSDARPFAAKLKPNLHGWRFVVRARLPICRSIVRARACLNLLKQKVFRPVWVVRDSDKNDWGRATASPTTAFQSHLRKPVSE